MWDRRGYQAKDESIAALLKGNSHSIFYVFTVNTELYLINLLDLNFWFDVSLIWIIFSCFNTIFSRNKQFLAHISNQLLNSQSWLLKEFQNFFSHSAFVLVEWKCVIPVLVSIVCDITNNVKWCSENLSLIFKVSFWF